MTSSVAKTCFDAIRAKQSAVVAGYDPIVVESQSVYENLLLRAVNSSSVEEESETNPDTRTKARTRQQTPLVNAGYASRVLCISYAIRSFVSYHKFVSSLPRPSQPSKKPSYRIRIVLLGCGVDVIGFWARSLLQADDNTIALTIIEIDKPEVCSVKRKMIANSGMVENLMDRNFSISTSTNAAKSQYYTGTIVLPSSILPSSNESIDTSSPGNGEDDPYDYVLIPGDLNDPSTIEPSFSLVDECKQEEIPTLVVSELVLSYLSPSGKDRLLRWCSNRICRTTDSALVFLEPLGFPIEAKDTATPVISSEAVISVEEGFQQDYCRKFHEKMKRGISSKAQMYSNTLYHPIGSSADIISVRVKAAGFGCLFATGLGEFSYMAAASVFSSKRNSNDAKVLVCPEIFDEYAALVLHLQSYILAYALVSSKTKKRTVDSVFHRLLCPWGHRPITEHDMAMMRSGLPIMDAGRGIVYNEIEVSDEASVRSLFQNTYGKEYTDKFPAIRKMVKTVLNSDLRATAIPTNITQFDDDTNFFQNDQFVFNDSASAIGNFYRSSGGIFLVATKYTMHNLPKYTIECKTREYPIPSKVREVVGCVGIRSHVGNDIDSRRILEIFRLTVAHDHRRCGIGRTLLQAVEVYARELRRKEYRSLKLVANTLTTLKDATRLYDNFGYESGKETPLGTKLTLRTYTKQVDIGD